MKNNTADERSRYEIVLLEDEPDVLKMLKEKLEMRGIIVRPYMRGDDALKKIMDDPNIGALVTDIEIRYPFPTGKRDGLQGYEVANRILSDSPNRLLSVIVLTKFEEEEALDSVPLFNMRIRPISKRKWTKLNDPKDVELTFDAIGLLIKEYIELTPNRWINEVNQIYPTSRWVREYKKGGNIFPPYWEIYRNLWFYDKWKKIEPEIGEEADRIVQSYVNGEYLRLRGDHLSLTEKPNETTFQEHLIGRRVVYALKALKPDYWESMIMGRSIDEYDELKEGEKPSLDSKIWQNIQSDEVRSLVNKLMEYAADRNLVDKHNKVEDILQKMEDLEMNSKGDSIEYEKLRQDKEKLSNDLRHEKKAMLPTMNQLAKALEMENEEIQQGFIPFLRFWNLDFTEVKWNKKSIIDKKGPFKQLLLLLGIREEDIRPKIPDNWRLLLPEERKWLRTILQKY